MHGTLCTGHFAQGWMSCTLLWLNICLLYHKPICLVPHTSCYDSLLTTFILDVLCVAASAWEADFKGLLSWLPRGNGRFWRRCKRNWHRAQPNVHLVKTEQAGVVFFQSLHMKREQSEICPMDNTWWKLNHGVKFRILRDLNQPWIELIINSLWKLTVFHKCWRGRMTSLGRAFSSA